MSYRPLPIEVTIQISDIEGMGLFSTCAIEEGTNLGMTHYKASEVDEIIRTPLGGFINHSEEPNMVRKQVRIEPYWDKWTITTTEDIKKGEELTLKYTMYRVDNAD